MRVPTARHGQLGVNLERAKLFLQEIAAQYSLRLDQYYSLVRAAKRIYRSQGGSGGGSPPQQDDDDDDEDEEDEEEEEEEADEEDEGLGFSPPTLDTSVFSTGSSGNSGYSYSRGRSNSNSGAASPTHTWEGFASTTIDDFMPSQVPPESAAAGGGGSGGRGRAGTSTAAPPRSERLDERICRRRATLFAGSTSDGNSSGEAGNVLPWAGLRVATGVASASSSSGGGGGGSAESSRHGGATSNNTSLAGSTVTTPRYLPTGLINPRGPGVPPDPQI